MPDDAKSVTAAIVIIGTEILSGRTQDMNVQFLATRLNELGVQLREVRVVADIEDAVVKAVNECRAEYDYLFTTGGIGPTHDDITSHCLAKAFGVRNVLNDEAKAVLVDHYAGGELNEARLRMAHTPEGATLIENPISKAPGYQIGNVFVLAGVPVIMQAMFESLRHRLVGGAPVRSLTISVALPEGRLARPLGVIQGEFTDVEIGSYPFFRAGVVGCSLVLRSDSEARLAVAGDRVRRMIRDAGGEPVEDHE